MGDRRDLSPTARRFGAVVTGIVVALVLAPIVALVVGLTVRAFTWAVGW